MNSSSVEAVVPPVRKEEQRRIAVIYAYYEKNDLYRENLTFFLRHTAGAGLTQAVHSPYDVRYFIVVNGDLCTAEIPPTTVPIFISYQPNVGFDFAGYFTGLRLANEDTVWKPDSYFFINTSCRGPFLPVYYKGSWLDPFVETAEKMQAHLVGPTINVIQGKPEEPARALCQSYAFWMSGVLARSLNASGFMSKIYRHINDCIDYQEIGMSMFAIQNGFNISCLIPEYQRDYVADFRRGQFLENPSALKKYGDICYPGPMCFGREIHPYEVIFFKTSRPFSIGPLRSLTNAMNNLTR